MAGPRRIRCRLLNQRKRLAKGKLLLRLAEMPTALAAQASNIWKLLSQFWMIPVSSGPLQSSNQDFAFCRVEQFVSCSTPAESLRVHWARPACVSLDIVLDNVNASSVKHWPPAGKLQIIKRGSPSSVIGGTPSSILFSADGSRLNTSNATPCKSLFNIEATKHEPLQWCTCRRV